MTDPDFVGGMRVRREVLGDDRVDGSIARLSDFNRPFFDYLTRSVRGQVWSRETVDRRTRSCITLAILTALGCEDEIALHTRWRSAMDCLPKRSRRCCFTRRCTPAYRMPAAPCW